MQKVHIPSVWERRDSMMCKGVDTYKYMYAVTHLSFSSIRKFRIVSI